MAERERLASLISGGGTTMQEIVKACKSGEIPMDVGCVIASTWSAGGIEKAKALGIAERDVVVINPARYKKADGVRDTLAFGEAILEQLQDRNITVVAQNGWLPLTPPNVLEAYPNRIFNQHPGYLPDFGGAGMYGRRVHAATLLYRRMENRDNEMWTEVVGQYAYPKFDEGPVVKSKRVPIFPDDTVDDLQVRTLPVEHRVQIEMLQDFVHGELEPQQMVTIAVSAQQKEMLVQAKKLAQFLYPKG